MEKGLFHIRQCEDDKNHKEINFMLGLSYLDSPNIRMRPNGFSQGFHSCLIPLVIWKVLESSSLVGTRADGEVYRTWIAKSIVPLNPNLESVLAIHHLPICSPTSCTSCTRDAICVSPLNLSMLTTHESPHVHHSTTNTSSSQYNKTLQLRDSDQNTFIIDNTQAGSQAVVPFSDHAEEPIKNPMGGTH